MPPARPGDELHRRLARNLRALARARRVPLSHLADRAGVGRTQLWDLMAGRRSVTLRWLERVARALEVDPADLLAPDQARRRG
jgi:transcriptional regulator with XRE-family HTH domain